MVFSQCQDKINKLKHYLQDQKFKINLNKQKNNKLLLGNPHKKLKIQILYFPRVIKIKLHYLVH